MNEQTIANLTQKLVNEEAISRAASAMELTDVAFFVFKHLHLRLLLSPVKAPKRHLLLKVSTMRHTR